MERIQKVSLASGEVFVREKNKTNKK